MKAFFWNKEEKRIRAPYRVFILIVLTAIFANILSLAFDDLNELLEKSLLNFLIMTAILLSIYIVGTFIDKRRWVDFGITLLPVKSFFSGAFLGAFLVTLIFGLMYLLGWLEINDLGYNKFSTYPFLLIFIGQIFRYLCGSVFEEAFNRGYLLINIAEGLNGRLSNSKSVLISYILTSSIFGILHLGNDNSSLLSTINLILLGLLFGWVVVKTGKLSFAIGLHAFWNIFQNNVYGGANSGKETIVSIFTFENSGNILWTGGDFGIEGSLLTTIIISLTLLVMMRSEIFGNNKFNQKILKK
ncbi:CPBP family intramembrane metalloprotease [Flavobacteriaceae bacterium AU392]|nr:CPBP family intramembrane metalloprotease [Flavobacteriaceae bacterium]RKM85959.1 CPBP family intramembrane metalloprotease [Flavobacteriaceae bacterium AU392]